MSRRTHGPLLPSFFLAWNLLGPYSEYTAAWFRAAVGPRLLMVAPRRRLLRKTPCTPRFGQLCATAPLEGRGLKLQAQFGRATPGVKELRVGGSASNFSVLVPILRARGVAEVVGMELGHHVDRRLRHVLGNPFENRIRAAFDMIGHD